MSSFNGTSPSLDNLFLQNLMGRLQIRPPPNPNPNPNSNLPQSLQDLLLDAAADFPFSDDDDDSDIDNESSPNPNPSKTHLANEESKLEKALIKVILAGNTDSLKPNSGQAVSVGDHHVCVGFHDEPGSDYRVWEWHGHIMLFDDEDGFSPEYIYGNYFERVRVLRDSGGNGGVRKNEEVVEEEEEKVGNLGLRELIEVEGSSDCRVLHRNFCANSPKF